VTGLTWIQLDNIVKWNSFDICRVTGVKKSFLPNRSVLCRLHFNPTNIIVSYVGYHHLYTGPIDSHVFCLFPNMFHIWNNPSTLDPNFMRSSWVYLLPQSSCYILVTQPIDIVYIVGYLVDHALSSIWSSWIHLIWRNRTSFSFKVHQNLMILNI